MSGAREEVGLLDRLKRRLGLGPKDEEWIYASTYETLDKADNWTHYGVGRLKPVIPTLVWSSLANGLYLLFLVVGIVLKMAKYLFEWMPWIFGGMTVAIIAWTMWVKSRYDGRLVLRLGIWWRPDKVILGDFLVNEDATREVTFGHIHRAAAKFAGVKPEPAAGEGGLSDAG